MTLDATLKCRRRRQTGEWRVPTLAWYMDPAGLFTSCGGRVEHPQTVCRRSCPYIGAAWNLVDQDRAEDITCSMPRRLLASWD